MIQRLPAICVSLVVLGLLLGVPAPGSASDEPIDINVASAEQLQSLPRIGPAVAGRIIQFREENGPFQSVDELLNVRGIGKKTLEQLRDHVTVSQKTADKRPRR